MCVPRDALSGAVGARLWVQYYRHPRRERALYLRPRIRWCDVQWVRSRFLWVPELSAVHERELLLAWRCRCRWQRMHVQLQHGVRWANVQHLRCWVRGVPPVRAVQQHCGLLLARSCLNRRRRMHVQLRRGVCWPHVQCLRWWVRWVSELFAVLDLRSASRPTDEQPGWPTEHHRERLCHGWGRDGCSRLGPTA